MPQIRSRYSVREQQFEIRFGIFASLAIALLLLALLPSPASAQVAGTLTFSAQNTSGNGTVTPVLTWSTSPAAASCAASGDWTGPKAASGSETLAPISSSKSYVMTCTWNDDKATLRWVAPTTRSDGSPLTNLASFKIYYGQALDQLTLVKSVSDPTSVQRVIQPLAAGTWFFGITVVDAAGLESALSAVVSKVLGAANASRSIGITVNPLPNAPGNLTVQ